jgi:5-methylcytosine-specific restriction enzyme A
MSRKEFSKATKRAALERSDGGCEATGIFYGLSDGSKCFNRLSRGVEFDHILACSNGGDNSLANCLAICPICHRFKTKNHDTPRAAKIKRQSDKHTGVTRPKQTIGQRRVLREVVAKAAGGKGHSAHEAAMEAKGKRVVPRRII